MPQRLCQFRSTAAFSRAQAAVLAIATPPTICYYLLFAAAASWPRDGSGTATRRGVAARELCLFAAAVLGAGRVRLSSLSCLCSAVGGQGATAACHARFVSRRRLLGLSASGCLDRAIPQELAGWLRELMIRSALCHALLDPSPPAPPSLPSSRRCMPPVCDLLSVLPPPAQLATASSSAPL